METSRLYVANLPSNVHEDDIYQLFQDYGEVVKVEIKSKENPVDPEDVKVLAFVTLKISSDDLQYCINDTNWQKIKGAKIKVSIAKESFLDRLKRERAEAESSAVVSSHISQIAEPSPITKNAENTRRTFDVHAELDDEDIAPDLLISKKRAANSLHNGKIVIQSYDTKPLHVIETKKVSRQTKTADVSNQKRQDAVMQKKRDYQEKKSTIQKALAAMDGSMGKKIKFSDSEDDGQEDHDTSINKQSMNLFDSDNEGIENGEGDHLKLSSKHFGAKGEQLMKLQSKQSVDPRFRFNDKFIEVDDEVEETVTQPETNGSDEREWQLGIIEQVIGVKLDTVSPAEKAKQEKKMLRYDPSKAEHDIFLRKEEEKIEDSQQSRRKTTVDQSQSRKIGPNLKPENTAEVSKEVFYVVTDTLRDALKSRGDGFSLLNMFGNVNGLEERDRQLQELSNEKILVKKSAIEPVNPFNYDSSSDDDTEHLDGHMPVIDLKNVATKKNSKSKATKLKMEPFFFKKNDIRLKEGSQFFVAPIKEAKEGAENYDEIRNRLGLLIKRKIKKTMRHFDHKKRNKKRKL